MITLKPKVVIIGIGFSSRLCLIRSIAAIGAEISVIVVGHVKHMPVDCYSKYVNKIYYCEGNNKKRLLQIITENCIDNDLKPILIPINDFAASVIDRNIDTLKNHFLFPHIHMRQGAVTVWMNKEKQKDLAKECGLDVVSSKNVEIEDHQYTMPENINYPCFTKTREYTTGYKGTLHRCNNKKELQQVLNQLSTKHKQITIMVEDYKEIETEYAAVGLSTGNEVIIPGVIEILLMAEGSVKGVACQGKIMPLTGYKELITRFKEFVSKTGFIGLFDIDFYLSGGVYYFGELNLRIGGSAYAVSKMGVNLPAMFVKSLLGESIDNMEKEILSSATFVNEKICSDHWYEGFMSTKEFRRILRSSDISFVEDYDDTAPGKKMKKELETMRLKRFIKKCLGKI